MPPEIDVAARLDAIAEATLELAQEGGARAVTVRAVAGRLGGSTTLVTQYVPSRSALLANAYRWAREDWDGDAAADLGDRTGIDRLRALATWSLDTAGYDDAMRRLWIDAISTRIGDVDGVDLPTHQARSEREHIGAVVGDALGLGHDWLADALFLVFRGFYLSTVEDGETWEPARAQAAVERLLDRVLAGDADDRSPRSS